jgi:hypothetical protein
MKSIKLLACIALSCVLNSTYAQDWEGATYRFGEVYPGYIVKLNGDTLRGFVLQQGRSESQDKVTFFTDPNDRKSKVVYKPADLKGYAVGDKTYRSIRYSGCS